MGCMHLNLLSLNILVSISYERVCIISLYSGNLTVIKMLSDLQSLFWFCWLFRFVALFSFSVVIQTTPAFLGTFLATPSQSPAQSLLVTFVILGVLSLAAFPACMLSHFSHVRLFATAWTVATRLLCPWNSAGKNSGVGWFQKRKVLWGFSSLSPPQTLFNKTGWSIFPGTLQFIKPSPSL